MPEADRGRLARGHLTARLWPLAKVVVLGVGVRLREDDCRELVSRTTGRPSLFRREALEGTDDRGVIGRMLLNLKHIYVERQDYRRALAAVDRLLIVRPGDPTEVRDRGFLKAHLGEPGPAILISMVPV